MASTMCAFHHGEKRGTDLGWGAGWLGKLNPHCMEEIPFRVGYNYGFGKQNPKKKFFKRPNPKKRNLKFFIKMHF